MDPNSFSPTTVGYGQSVILGATDMNAIRPDVSETLFNQYGDQFAREFQLWMTMHGAMFPTKNPEGGRLFQEDRFDRVVTVGANTGTSGVTLDFDLDVSEIETIPGGYTVYPRVGDTIIDMTTMTRGRVTKVDLLTTPGACNIEAVSLAGVNWVVPSAGKQYAIYGNSNPENSDGPNARNSYWTAKPYKLQILREAATTTDLALGADLFPIRDQQGNYTRNWSSVSYVQMEFRLLKQVYTTLWLGQNTTATGQPTTTTGYYQEFSTGANGVNVGPDDYEVHLADLTDLLLENSPMSPNYFSFINRNLINPFQTDLYTRYADANIIQAQETSAKYLFGENATAGMLGKFDFQTLIFNGMTYNIRLNKTSYDPNTLGLDPTQNLFANTAYFMPTMAGTDAEAKLARNCMLRYLELPGINQAGGQKIYFFENGALAAIPTNRQLNRTSDAVIWFGAQFCNLAQCGFWYKAVGS